MRHLGQETALRDLLALCLRSGGFPKVVAELKAHRGIEETTCETLLAVLSSEIEKQRRSASTLRSILQALYGAVPRQLATICPYLPPPTTENIPYL